MTNCNRVQIKLLQAPTGRMPQVLVLHRGPIAGAAVITIDMAAHDPVRAMSGSN